MAARIERVSATHPWLVAEEGGEVVGYAYACPYRERAAYRWAADVSVYVADGRAWPGPRPRLYEALFERLRRQQLPGRLRRHHPAQRRPASPCMKRSVSSGRRQPADRLEGRGLA